MRFRKLSIAVAIALVGVAACAYYFVGRHAYVKSAKAAFPRLPVDNCYYLPWPIGPRLVGQLHGDDPIYLGRDSMDKNANGMHLTIADSDGTFWIMHAER
jgi:hypothetical protein